MRTIVIDADPGISAATAVPGCIVTVTDVPANFKVNKSPAFILIINSLLQI